MLPDLLDGIRIPTDETLAQVIECALYSLGVTFERSLTPTDDAVSSINPYEEPSRRDSEYLWVDSPISGKA